MRHQRNDAPISHEDLVDQYVVLGKDLVRVKKEHGRQSLGPVGTLHVGYGGRKSLVVRIRGRLVYVSRLIVYWHTGRWPELVVDHLNGDSLDNSIDNLEEVPQATNVARGRRHNLYNYM